MHLGSTAVASNNRARSQEAHAALDELIGKAIVGKDKGALAVRLTFRDGKLWTVRRILELDNNGEP